MAYRGIYLPKYAESWALIIGINTYRHVGPLIHACNDAREVARTLIERFGFPKDNVKLLLDDRATRQSIMNSFLSYTDDTKIGENDRILVFFAGHGHTMTGRREIGFL